MAEVILGIVFLNIVLFGGLAAWGTRQAVREKSPRIRPLIWALVAVAGAFVLSSLTRVVSILIARGVIPGALTDFLGSGWVLIQALGATGIGVYAMVVIRRSGTQLRRADRAVSLLTDRLFDGVSLEDFGFTEREYEVLEIIAGGTLSDQEISEVLFISPATAATHVRNILRKSGIRSRRELVLLFHSQSE